MRYYNSEKLNKPFLISLCKLTSIENYSLITFDLLHLKVWFFSEKEKKAFYALKFHVILSI